MWTPGGGPSWMTSGQGRGRGRDLVVVDPHRLGQPVQQGQPERDRAEDEDRAAEDDAEEQEERADGGEDRGERRPRHVDAFGRRRFDALEPAARLGAPA